MRFAKPGATCASLATLLVLSSAVPSAMTPPSEVESAIATGLSARPDSSAEGVALREVNRSTLVLHASAGRVYDSTGLFTGQATIWHLNGQRAERTTYRNGRKEGLAERWYAEGVVSYRANYRDNRRHGSVETWWSDGTLRSSSYYVSGVAEGIQRQWYPSGALFKELNLAAGQEEGLQRAWRENGKLYANYEVRGGVHLRSKARQPMLYPR